MNDDYKEIFVENRDLTKPIDGFKEMELFDKVLSAVLEGDKLIIHQALCVRILMIMGDPLKVIKLQEPILRLKEADLA